MTAINQTEAWVSLLEEAEKVKGLHLRDLLQDSQRCASLVAEHSGIYLDFSRENVTVETIQKLIALAEEAGLQSKIAAMATGIHFPLFFFLLI